MAINLVGTATGSAIDGGAVTVALPAGIATGDLILAIHGSAGTADAVMPTPSESGYTGVSELYSDDTVDANSKCWYKYHDGDANISLPAIGGAGDANTVTVMVFRGVKAAGDGGPWDTTPATATGINTNIPNPPSIDHSGAAGVVTVIAMCSAHQGGSGATYTSHPTGYNATGNKVSVGAADETNDCTTGMAVNFSPADPEDPGTVLISVGDSISYSWTAYTFALAPANAAGIQRLGGTSSSAANGASITLTLSNIGGLQENDLVIITMIDPVAGGWAGAERSPQSGDWTLLTPKLSSDDTQDANLVIWGKFMGATPDTTVTINGSADANSGNVAAAMAFRGVDKTRPLDVIPTTATGINTAIPNPPSITPSGASGVVTVIVASSGHTNDAVGYTAFPTGYAGGAVTAGGNDVNDSTIGIACNISPSNPEDPGTISIATDSVNFAWCAATIALRPTETTGIRLVGMATGTNNNGSNVTITLPTLLEGDLVIVAHANSTLSEYDMTMVTTGYTEAADLFSNDTEDVNLGVFYKLMGATPDTTAVCTGSGNANSGEAAVALCFRKVDSVTPMDATPTTSQGNTNSGDPIPPDITYPSADAIIVVAGGSGTTVAAMNLGLYQFGRTALGNDAEDVLVGLGFFPGYMDPSPADPGQMWPLSDAVSYSWCAATLALDALDAGTGFPIIVMMASA